MPGRNRRGPGGMGPGTGRGMGQCIGKGRGQGQGQGLNQAFHSESNHPTSQDFLAQEIVQMKAQLAALENKLNSL